MWDSFCNPCGKIHAGPRCVSEVTREDAAGNHIRITRKFSAAKMATAGDSADDRVLEDITKDVGEICIEEDERRIREEIRQLERDKRMFELAKRRDTLEKGALEREKTTRVIGKPHQSESGATPPTCTTQAMEMCQDRAGRAIDKMSPVPRVRVNVNPI